MVIGSNCNDNNIYNSDSSVSPYYYLDKEFSQIVADDDNNTIFPPPPASKYVLESLHHWGIPTLCPSSSSTSSSSSAHTIDGDTTYCCLICRVDCDDEDYVGGDGCDCGGVDNKRNDDSSRRNKTITPFWCGRGNPGEGQEITNKDDDDDDVSITITMMTQLPCGHVYHTGCIGKWLKRTCTCPTCRYELPTDDTFYEISREQRMGARRMSHSSSTSNSSSKSKVSRGATISDGNGGSSNRYCCIFWVPKESCHQTILRTLDYETSTSPVKYWQQNVCV